MGRPDLTYLTQAVFTQVETPNFMEFSSVIADQNIECVFHEDEDNKQYTKAVLKIPELVQCAEMLFDMTLDKPNSIIHKMVSDLLNELKEDK